MPIQDVTPWQRLLDAQMEAQEAGRGDDLERQKAALEGLRAAREEMACVGGLLIILALEHGGLVVQRKLGQVFGTLAAGAFEKAQRAEAAAADALERLDALKSEVRELRKQLEKRRPPELMVAR